MRKRRLPVLLGMIALGASCCGARSEDMVVVTSPSAVKWGRPPPNLPKDVQIAVLAGDPSKPGPFILRVKTTAKSKIAPHTHLAAENLTIISGSVYQGMGTKFDKTKGEKISAGGFVYLPANMPHYLWGDEPAEIQVTGVGPFAVNYVDPADDPSAK